MDVARDTQALFALKGQIQEQTGGRVRDLRIEHQGESLILQGSARTFYAKQLAQEAVRRIGLMLRVQNEIVVCR